MRPAALLKNRKRPFEVFGIDGVFGAVSDGGQELQGAQALFLLAESFRFFGAALPLPRQGQA
jgi:hypothetical protein